ncbi:unnamed protein product [Aspergillus oryzae]|nr:unnamed protein product [Aspergillus oryzae]GMF95816.1 unnamed protein product [Aspergillus oryzae]
MATTTTKPAWYQTSVTAIDPAAQSMLENYSRLKPEEVIPHVLALLYGFDLEAGFFELGYKLFRDNADAFPATFVGADLGGSDEDWEKAEIMGTMKGKIDVVWAGSLLHFWEYEGQLRGVERLIGLTRGEPGSIVCGRQMGSTVAGVYDLNGLTDKTMLHYRHNVESLVEFWKEVGVRTGSKWEVQAELEIGETTTNMRDKAKFMDDNTRVIWWCATRVE